MLKGENFKEGAYYALLVSRKDGTFYTAYFRCIHRDFVMDHVVFVDDTRARVSMMREYAQNMRLVASDEQHPIINLDVWIDNGKQKA